MAGCSGKRYSKGGMTEAPVKKMMMGGMAKNNAYKAGGKIDGCAIRGRTKGTMR